MNFNLKDLMKNQIMEHTGRSIGLLLGLVIAVLMLSVGFWATIFIVICVAIGAYIGECFDSKDCSRLRYLADKIQQLLTPNQRL